MTRARNKPAISRRFLIPPHGRFRPYQAVSLTCYSPVDFSLTCFTVLQTVSQKRNPEVGAKVGANIGEGQK
jgi:hypothetical protein